MAVPGSPLDPRCRGCNRLIREYGTLVEDAEQILEALDQMVRPTLEESNEELTWENVALPSDKELDNHRREILIQLSPSPVAIDELLRQCQCSPTVLGVVLLELELAGKLERHPGNKVSLIVEAL